MTTIAAQAAPETITVALKNASARTGVEFDYLLQTAKRESGLNAAANAKTSSAVGLFQFIEGTWMETLKASGAKYGLGEAAAAIQKSPSGRYDVADPGTKAAILALRTDPAAAALMAGELTQSNARKLQIRLGRAPSQGELYIAHFLGAGGAGQLISAATNRPDDIASQSFPAAARANPSIFYDRDGKARTVGEVYRNLVAYHQRGSASAIAAIPAAGSGPLDITPDRAKAGLAPLGVGETGYRPVPALAIAAYTASERPLYSLFLPLQDKSGPASGARSSTAAEPAPAKPQALMATLKAYGVPPPAQPPATPQSQGKTSGRALWGGGLFTNAQVQPAAMQGGLFTVPASSAR